MFVFSTVMVLTDNSFKNGFKILILRRYVMINRLEQAILTSQADQEGSLAILTSQADQERSLLSNECSQATY